MNEVFQPLHLEMRGGSLGLDFSGFDLTMLASVDVSGERGSEHGRWEERNLRLAWFRFVGQGRSATASSTKGARQITFLCGQ
jgi:hypothetical protein